MVRFMVIYNFFKDALPFVLNLWSKVLNHMKFSVTENPNIGYFKKELEFEETPKDIMEEVLYNFKDKISISYTDILDENMRHKLYNMCAELKELYVAITRAKTSFFFLLRRPPVKALFRPTGGLSHLPL